MSKPRRVAGGSQWQKRICCCDKTIQCNAMSCEKRVKCTIQCASHSHSHRMTACGGCVLTATALRLYISTSQSSVVYGGLGAARPLPRTSHKRAKPQPSRWQLWQGLDERGSRSRACGATRAGDKRLRRFLSSTRRLSITPILLLNHHLSFFPAFSYIHNTLSYLRLFPCPPAPTHSLAIFNPIPPSCPKQQAKSSAALPANA